MEIWKNMRVRSRLDWRNFKRSPRVRWVEKNWLKLGKFVIIIFLALSAILWLIQVPGKVWTWTTSILPPNFWWWILGAVVLAIVIALARWALKGKNIPFKPGKWLRWAVVLGILVFVYQEYGKDIHHFLVGGTLTPSRATPAMITGRLPADIVLPIIAQCESRGRQFDDNGNVIVSSTQDYGKWQINLPTHGKEINRKTIDIWTEEGNEQFARILYERNELSDWQATRHCWEPKLMALGRKISMPVANIATDFMANVARPGQPVEAVMDLGWCMKARGDGDKFDTAVEWRGETKIRTFTTKPGVEETTIWISFFPC